MKRYRAIDDRRGRVARVTKGIGGGMEINVGGGNTEKLKYITFRSRKRFLLFGLLDGFFCALNFGHPAL